MSGYTKRSVFADQPNRISTRWQYELYHKLRLAGFSVLPEVSFPSPVHTSGKFIADIVIYDERFVPVGLIEVKDEGERLSDKQRTAYESTGIPWIVSDYLYERETLDWATKLLSNRRSEDGSH